MKNEIIKEILKFDDKHALVPIYSDLVVSRYHIDKEFGSLEKAVLAAGICKQPGQLKKVVRYRFDRDDLIYELEEELWSWSLSHNQFPKVKDCGFEGLRNYRVYKNNIGGFSESILLYDDIKTVVNSRREIIGKSKPNRFFDPESGFNEVMKFEPDYERMYYRLLVEHLNFLKGDLIRDFKYGSILVEYGDGNDPWEYRLHRYQKYSEHEYELVFKERYNGERFEKSKPVAKY